MNSQITYKHACILRQSNCCDWPALCVYGYNFARM